MEKTKMPWIVILEENDTDNRKEVEDQEQNHTNIADRCQSINKSLNDDI